MTRRRFKLGRLYVRLRRIIRNDQLTLSILGFVVGAVAGGAIIGFREAIGLFQTVFFATGSERLYLYVQGLPWWRVLLAPAAGGLIVGLLVRFLMPRQRPQSVADVIEAAAACRPSAEWLRP